MSARIRLTATVTVVAAFFTSPVTAGEPPPLVNNPFSRPLSAVPIPDRGVAGIDGPAREIDLRATIVTTQGRLANVAGRTLRPGEEVQGYTLVQVYEDRAVFSEQGKQLIIYVKANAEVENE